MSSIMYCGLVFCRLSTASMNVRAIRRQNAVNVLIGKVNRLRPQIGLSGDFDYRIAENNSHASRNWLQVRGHFSKQPGHFS